MKKLLSRKAKVISAVAAISLVTILGTTAFALSNISLTLGKTLYDFGAGPIPATVQIHVFTMKPGDTIPWQACSIYIYSDVAFDLHYVNAQGNEISADEALKAVRKRAATEMK